MHIPDLKYAAMINGFDCWNITKLDVLDTEEEIFVGVGENADGSVLYERLPGWKSSTEGVRSSEKLPLNAQNFIQFIEKTRVSPCVSSERGRRGKI